MEGEVKISPLPRGSSSASVRKSRAKGKRGVANRVVSAVGRCIEQLSRLYGYALLMCGFNAVLLSGVSALPLTKWDDKGVPRSDALVVSALVALVLEYREKMCGCSTSIYAF